MKRFFLFYASIFALIYIYSCDAPHSNPLDALNPDYSYGIIEGFVFSLPRNSLTNVKVIWKNENKMVYTDNNGYYKLNDILRKDGLLFFEKEGLKKDSVFIKWDNLANIRVPDKVMDFNIGQIKGSIKTVSLPRKGIQNVKVYWKNQNVLVFTDSEGNFGLSNILYNNGWLTFEKEGYKKDSVFVQFGSQNIVQLNDIYLNSIPRLDSVNISTTVVHRYTETRYRLYVQVKIFDAESDIKEVKVENSAINFNQQLNYNSLTGYYEGNYDFGKINLSAAIGKDFIITVHELNDNYTIFYSKLTRVIDKEIILKEPINSSIVGSLPILVWERFSPGFIFKYKAEIYTATIPSELFWSKNDISSEDIRCQVDIPLPSGNYYWVIWCIDEYNNQSRSKEASFIVK